MKHKNNNGFTRIGLLLAVLGVITIGLAAVGILQNNSSKKLFTAPVKASTTAKSSSTSHSSLSSNDQALATSNLATIDFTLEAYFASFSYYPSTIAASEFTALANNGGFSGTSPVTTIKQVTSVPTGVSYSYLPTPSGCTTAAKSCLHFTLSAKDSKGNTIGQPQESSN